MHQFPHRKPKPMSPSRGASAGTVALAIDGQRLRNLDPLRRFYAQRGFDPVWTDASGAVPAATGLVALLRAAAQEGLDPLHYHADAIERRIGSAGQA